MAPEPAPSPLMAELTAEFVRVPVPVQALWESAARAVLGDVGQRRLIAEAAQLWERGGLPGVRMHGPLPLLACRMKRRDVVHWTLTSAVRVHLPGSRGQGLRRDAGSLLCVAPSSRSRYPGTPRPAPDAAPTCAACLALAAAYSAERA
jgi:hypothetical protein